MQSDCECFRNFTLLRYYFIIGVQQKPASDDQWVVFCSDCLDGCVSIPQFYSALEQSLFMQLYSNADCAL